MIDATLTRGYGARLSEARRRAAMAGVPPVVRREPDGGFPAPQMPSIRASVRRKKVGEEYGEPMRPSIAPPAERPPEEPPPAPRAPYRNDTAEWIKKHPWQAGFMNVARPGSVDRAFRDEEQGKRWDDEQRRREEDHDEARQDRKEAREERHISQGRQLAESTGDPEMLHHGDPHRTALAGAINRNRRGPAVHSIPGMRASKVTSGGVTYEPEPEPLPPGFKPKSVRRGDTTYEQPEAPQQPPPGFKPTRFTKGGVTYEGPERPEQDKPMSRAVLQGAIAQRREAELKLQADLDVIAQKIKDAEVDTTVDVPRLRQRKEQVEAAYRATVAEREAFEREFAGSNTSDGGLSKEEFDALMPEEQREYLKANKPPR